MFYKSVTRNTYGLEAWRLPARERDVLGRRAVFLRLTLAGRAKLDEIRSIAVQRWGKVPADLAGDDVARLIALRSNLADSIERNVLAPACSLVEA